MQSSSHLGQWVKFFLSHSLRKSGIDLVRAVLGVSMDQVMVDILLRSFDGHVTCRRYLFCLQAAK
ncbi:hypothetical protein OF001_U300049 [Pseudomonas sp. OF001]|nr:hypothetical protein OF001_U300049 [Pseudomonas sp. OF001]